MQEHDSGWRGWLHAILRAFGLRQVAHPAPTIPAPRFIAQQPAPGNPFLPASDTVPEIPWSGTPNENTYALRDDFLSPAEVSFFHVLRLVVAERYLIFPKVRLADLVFPPKQEGQFGAWQRINRKHIDFVLCDARSLRPVAALELDDRSHRRPDRLERDAFVDRVFADARIPLMHVSAQRTYHTEALGSLLTQTIPAFAPLAPAHQEPIALDRHAPVPPQGVRAASAGAPTCARCGGEMRLRTAAQGQHRGEQFWGCANYPRCRNTAPLTADVRDQVEA